MLTGRWQKPVGLKCSQSCTVEDVDVISSRSSHDLQVSRPVLNPEGMPEGLPEGMQEESGRVSTAKVAAVLRASARNWWNWWNCGHGESAAQRATMGHQNGPSRWVCRCFK
eukprot:s1080_g29.t1